MNCKIPFTKDIDMGKKVSEITSISLEHEIKIEEGILKGNFIVSGEFKSHEVSVNKEAFSYLLPFEIELLEDVDENTVEFMIDDFTYEIVDQNFLKVNIDFNVIASKKEKIEEEEEPLFKDARELFQDTNVTESSLPSKEVALTNEPKQEEKVIDQSDRLNEETKEEIVENTEEERANMNITEEKKEEKITKETEDTIIDTIKNVNDEYATYHIHMVSDGETIETICTMYNSNINILSDYNDLNEITVGDKLIIPEKNE